MTRPFDSNTKSALRSGAWRAPGTEPLPPLDVLGGLDQSTVRLYAERVDLKVVGLASVVGGGYEELDAVFRIDVIALREVGMNRAVCFERAHAEIHRVGGVPYEHLRRIGGGYAVGRRELREPVSVAARYQTGSSSLPSMVASASTREGTARVACAVPT